MMAIPLFDCRIPRETAAVLDPLWQSGSVASGHSVGELERRLGDRFGGREVVAVSDMTHALAMALYLAGVRAGDLVATLAFNCLSSNSALILVGAHPVWVDVDPETATVDRRDLVAVLGLGVKAVVVYHVAGMVADLSWLRNTCDQAGVALIEDANNALGASWQDRPVASFGDFSVLSFYANRQLNGIEGGAIVFSDPEHAQTARRRRRFGIDVPRFRTADGEIDPALDVPEIGVSSTLSNVNATLALAALETLDGRLASNRRNAAILAARLDGNPHVSAVRSLAGAQNAYWVGLVKSPHRSAILDALKGAGIGCSKLHQRNDVYSGFASPRRSLPGTDLLSDQMFAVPIGWWVNPSDMTRITDAIATAIDND